MVRGTWKLWSRLNGILCRREVMNPQGCSEVSSAGRRIDPIHKEVGSK